MGCGHSSDPKYRELSPESSEVFNQLIHEFNNYVKGLQSYHDFLSKAYELSDSALSIFSIRFSDDISDQILVKYIEFILLVYKSITLGNDKDKWKFYFTNYLPGIAIKSRKNSTNDVSTVIGNYGDGLHKTIDDKLHALDNLCKQIFEFVRDFPLKNDQIIKTVVMLRDEYPKRFYEAASSISGLRIVSEFASIENTLTSNFQIFSEVALRFDKFFYNTRAILIKIHAMIDVCGNDFGSFKKYFSVIQT